MNGSASEAKVQCLLLTGNTVGPIEALRIGPTANISALLIAKSKPNKAIEFDTGMGLVTLGRRI